MAIWVNYNINKIIIGVIIVLQVIMQTAPRELKSLVHRITGNDPKLTQVSFRTYQLGYVDKISRREGIHFRSSAKNLKYLNFYRED